MQIEINIEAVTWDDMELTDGSYGELALANLSDEEKAAKNAEYSQKVRQFFNRVVVGGAKAVPLIRTQEALTAIFNAVNAAQTSGN